MEVIRRLLMSVGAIHAVSWLWPSGVLSIADEGADDARPAKKTSTVGTRLALALPILRRKAVTRGFVLSPMFRLVVIGVGF